MTRQTKILLQQLLHNKYVYLIAAIILLTGGFICDTSQALTSGSLNNKTAIDKEVNAAIEQFELAVQERETQLIELLNDTSLTDLSRLKKDYLQITEKFRKSNFILLVYKDEILKYWSSNTITPELPMTKIPDGTSNTKLKNGWYVLRRINRGEIVLIGMFLIKSQYTYENQYLVNAFDPTFSLPEDFEISNTESQEENNHFDIHTADNKYLLTLKLRSGLPERITDNLFILILLYVTGFLTLLCFFWLLCKGFFKRNKHFTGIIVFLGFIAFIRIITLYFKIPSAVYGMEIFNPGYYASSLIFPSLGDLFINAFIVCLLSFFFYKYFPVRYETPNNNYYKILTPLTYLIILQLTDFLAWLIKGLIIHSSLSYEFSNIFSLDYYSLAGMFSLSLFLLAFIMITDILIRRCLLLLQSVRLLILYYSIAVILYFASKIATSEDFDGLTLIWTTLFIIFVTSIHAKGNRLESISNIIRTILLFSLFGGYIFYKSNYHKETEYRKYLASKFLEQQDVIGEHLFLDIEGKLCSDELIYKCFTDQKSNNQLHERIKQVYFSGYFERYDIKICHLDSNGNVLNNEDRINIEELNNKINYHGKITCSDNYFHILDESGNLTYIARLPVDSGLKHLGTMLMELKGKFVYYARGLPELLLDKNIQSNKELADFYSYVIYKNNLLVKQHGYYPYSLDGREFNSTQTEYEYADKDGYNHIIYRPNPDTLIVLSKKNNQFIDYLTIFSYLFTLFLLCALIFLSKHTYNALSKEESIYKNFATHIQISVLVFIFCLLLIIGTISFYSLQEYYDSYHKERLSRKTTSVLIALEYEYNKSNHLTDKGNKEQLVILINKLSSIHSIDINLFDLEGKLLTSSQPKIFDKGLIAPYINPYALYELREMQKIYLTQEEHIARLNYISSYVPVRSNRNSTIGFMSLPYFEREKDAKQDIALLFAALINIYAFVFVLVGLFSLFIYKPFIAPLELLRDRFRKTKVGQKNEPIQWNRKDEIGELVSEYNKMIFELEKSAELLARSEREMAWREMAKQIAHEIKNPLTPMKLSVQHLQHALADKSPDLNEKMIRLSQTLIHQIDNLSSIATEFSLFAKMPPTQNEALFIEEVIMTVINLFKETTTVQINFNKEFQDHKQVYADKDQMLRVFNNLIKNSIQSIPDNRRGTINITLSQPEGNIIIQIRDNGEGITEGQQSKIFEPNFTTKSSGMGLGLAITRKIIENANGKIWFETESGKGTAFFVSLPVLISQS